jgi:predicted nucleic acid-binding protein
MAATESRRQVVVCDAGPLIHLDELGCLPLLSDFPTVLVPELVWGEVSSHRPTAFEDAGVMIERRSATTPLPPNLESLGRLFALHNAEFDALHLALETNAGLFLTDDTAARLAARQLSIPVHGTRPIRSGSPSTPWCGSACWSAAGCGWAPSSSASTGHPSARACLPRTGSWGHVTDEQQVPRETNRDPIPDSTHVNPRATAATRTGRGRRWHRPG